MADKNPPSDKSLESSVIGTLLQDEDAITTCADLIDEEYFYSPQLQVVYRAVMDLWERGTPVDQVSVAHLLRDRNKLDLVDGEMGIVKIMDHGGSAANIRNHCFILRKLWKQRALIALSDSVSATCYDNADPDKVIGNMITRIDMINEGKASSDFIRVRDKIVDVMNGINERYEDGSKLGGISTGFPTLDKWTNGWQNGDYIVIGAKSSQGKTTLAVNFALTAAENGHKVGIFSMEMSEIRLIERMVSQKSSVDVAQIHWQKPSQSQFVHMGQVARALHDLPLWIDPTASLSTVDLFAHAKRLHRQEGIELIVIDYIQLMRGTSKESRQQEIEEISRGMKMLAKTLNIPVIVLSQLRATQPGQEDKMPTLSDLRGSGAINHDADLVIFIHDPSIKIKQDHLMELGVDWEQVNMRKIRELIIAKQRNGPQASIMMLFEGEYFRFKEIAFQHGT